MQNKLHHGRHGRKKPQKYDYAIKSFQQNNRERQKTHVQTEMERLSGQSLYNGTHSFLPGSQHQALVWGGKRPDGSWAWLWLPLAARRRLRGWVRCGEQISHFQPRDSFFWGFNCLDLIIFTIWKFYVFFQNGPTVFSRMINAVRTCKATAGAFWVLFSLL